MTDTPLWVGTGWKMNKTLAEALDYAGQLKHSLPVDGVNRFVLPPFTVLRDVSAALADTDITVGAQNMHWQDAGAWTGEISGPMLVDCGVRLVEIGHSERRTHFGETDKTVGLKVDAALRHGLTPLICVGETAEQKQAGRTDGVLREQVRSALARVPRNARVLFAYEPVWAIGEHGSPAEPDYADDQHARIKAVATEMTGTAPPVLYGGSVNAGNCVSFVSMQDVDGVFVGRAAWTAAGFADIVARCARARA